MNKGGNNNNNDCNSSSNNNSRGGGIERYIIAIMNHNRQHQKWN